VFEPRCARRSARSRRGCSASATHASPSVGPYDRQRSTTRPQEARGQPIALDRDRERHRRRAQREPEARVEPDRFDERLDEPLPLGERERCIGTAEAPDRDDGFTAEHGGAVETLEILEERARVGGQLAREFARVARRRAGSRAPRRGARGPAQDRRAGSRPRFSSGPASSSSPSWICTRMRSRSPRTSSAPQTSAAASSPASERIARTSSLLGNDAERHPLQVLAVARSVDLEHAGRPETAVVEELVEEVRHAARQDGDVGDSHPLRRAMSRRRHRVRRRVFDRKRQEEDLGLLFEALHVPPGAPTRPNAPDWTTDTGLSRRTISMTGTGCGQALNRTAKRSAKSERARNSRATASARALDGPTRPEFSIETGCGATLPRAARGDDRPLRPTVITDRWRSARRRDRHRPPFQQEPAASPQCPRAATRGSCGDDRSSRPGRALELSVSPAARRTRVPRARGRAGGTPTAPLPRRC
jgi:hypothetical protein